MRNWAAAGLPPNLFWRSTPREAEIILHGAQDRDLAQLRMQQRLIYSQAILTAYAVNDPKKMPKFEAAFPDGRPKQPMSPDQIMASMQQWSARLGATV